MLAGRSRSGERLAQPTSGHDDRLYLRRWEPAHSGLTLLALFLAVNPVAFGVTLRARDFSGQAL